MFAFRMNRRTLTLLTVLVCVQLVAQPALAVTTLWNFLGIPQGVNKIRDATANRRGNFPGLERKPPLKGIADPENLASKNPAIKKAAEIKQEEDLKPQKIKALKYLARIGCGCYPGVKEALMAALDDCTEEVRFVAAQQIGLAAGTKCATCNKNCCCDEDMTKKLAEVAYEKDDCGCWLEPSERVREAAREAMRLCCCANQDRGGVSLGFDVQETEPTQNEVVPPPPPAETVPPVSPGETVPPPPPSPDASALYEVDPSVLRGGEVEPPLGPETIRFGEHELVLDYSKMKGAPMRVTAPEPQEKQVVDLKPRLTEMFRSVAKAPPIAPIKASNVRQTSSTSATRPAAPKQPVVQPLTAPKPPARSSFDAGRISPQASATPSPTQSMAKENKFVVQPVETESDAASATITALKTGFSDARITIKR
jgi:hypothetical protein